MRTILLRLIPAAVLALSPVAALAAEGTATGAAGGAIAGAIVGGPVGAAVGGVICAIVGTAIEPPPPEVVSYAESADAPPPVVLRGNVVVGATLPRDVELYPIPDNVYAPADGHTYAYAIVNGRRVVVDADSRVIVAIAG